MGPHHENWQDSALACGRRRRGGLWGQPLLEVETDKITNVVESPAGGVLLQIVSPQGEVVPVMQVIGIIGESCEAVATQAASPVGATPAGSAAAASQGQSRPAAGNANQGEVRAMPAARRVAKELGVDLATVTGTGRDGIVTEKDVRTAHEAAAKTPPPAPAAPCAQACAASADSADEVIPMDGLRKLIADNMQASLQNAGATDCFCGGGRYRNGGPARRHAGPQQKRRRVPPFIQ